MPVYKIKYKKSGHDTEIEAKQFGFDQCHAVRLLRRCEPDFNGHFEAEEVSDHEIYCEVLYKEFSGVVVADYAARLFYVRATGSGYCMDYCVPIDNPEKIQRELIRLVKEHVESIEA